MSANRSYALSATPPVSLRGLCPSVTQRRTRELTRGLLDAIAGLMAHPDCENHSRKGVGMTSEPEATRVALVTHRSRGSMRERHQRYSSDSRTNTSRPRPGLSDQEGTR
jgi:hypothetical protein